LRRRPGRGRGHARLGRRVLRLRRPPSRCRGTRGDGLRPAGGPPLGSLRLPAPRRRADDPHRPPRLSGRADLADDRPPRLPPPKPVRGGDIDRDPPSGRDPLPADRMAVRPGPVGNPGLTREARETWRIVLQVTSWY